VNGIPIGQIFLNVITKGKGLHRKTFYEVVDGQQRLRAILGFMRDDLVLTNIPTRAYPVSKLYARIVGKKYSELHDDFQSKIWNYPIAVQELREYSPSQIREMFRRLNYVVERLTKQELRHSQFFGEFTKAVEHLAESPFWEKTGLFSRKDYQRMNNLEFVSELLIVVVRGIQEQKMIDEFYAQYDASFPAKSKHLRRFQEVLDRLSPFGTFIKNSRFSKKADFYALFAAMRELLNSNEWQEKKTNRAITKLKVFASALNRPPNKLKGPVREYYTTVIEGPNKLAKRVRRTELICDLLRAVSTVP
jgi:hypothetical protein